MQYVLLSDIYTNKSNLPGRLSLMLKICDTELVEALRQKTPVQPSGTIERNIKVML